jgi:hypothetical protein
LGYPKDNTGVHCTVSVGLIRYIGKLEHILGLFSSGTTVEIIVNPPLNMPAAPRPATALPTMKTVEEGATPHMSDPSSNKIVKPRYIYWIGLD